MNRATTMRRLGADVPKIKERITRAFAAMRKRGILARQRMPCCQSCSGARIEEMLDQRANRDDPKKRKTYTGYAFYHDQDAEALERMFEWYGRLERHCEDEPRPLGWTTIAATGLDPERCWSSTRLYIAYGTTADVGHPSELSTEEVGAIIVECLRGAGIVADWNGHPSTRICIPLMQDHMEPPKTQEKI